jgi:hypothetical protein
VAGRQRYRADPPPLSLTLSQQAYVNPTHATFLLLQSLLATFHSAAISGRQESHDGGQGRYVTSGHTYLSGLNSCTHRPPLISVEVRFEVHTAATPRVQRHFKVCLCLIQIRVIIGVLISLWLFLFAAQPKEFFLDGLKKLEHRNHKLAELGGGGM